jgi:uncharacterized membrane protein
MADPVHFWAIVCDDSARVEQMRRKLMDLAGDGNSVDSADVAVLECDQDGSYTLDQQPLPQSGNIFSGSTTWFLAGLTFGVPFSGSAFNARLGTAWSNISGNVGIDRKFVSELKRLMTPGRSALFVVDRVGGPQKILRGINSLGGKVLKTKADLKRARLIQSTLNEYSSTLRNVRTVLSRRTNDRQIGSL